MHYAKIHDPPVSQLSSLADAMQYEIYALWGYALADNQLYVILDLTFWMGVLEYQIDFGHPV